MTDPEFRRVSSEQRITFQHVLDYAFSPDSGPEEYDDPDSVPEGEGTRFAVVEGGDIRSVCVHHDFTASLRGDWIPVAGLAAVATMPEYRRQGYVRRMIGGSLREWRGEYPLSALWPFEYGYYEQFGWTMGCKLAKYTCEPSALASGRDAPGTAHRMDPDGWERLQSVDVTAARAYDLTVRRDEGWWRNRIFQRRGRKERYVYGLERDGSVRGYVAYTADSDDGTSRLDVLYSGFTDYDAYRGLLGFLSNHDSQTDEIRLYRGTETPLFELVDEPKAVDCEIHPGMMVRVVDVVDALETVPYPDERAGTVTIAVSDGTAPWNDGQFELTVSDGTGECRPVEDGEPDAHIDIGTLSQLFVGYHGVPAARELAGLRVETEDVATLLAEWFPSRPVTPMDNF